MTLNKLIQELQAAEAKAGPQAVVMVSGGKWIVELKYIDAAPGEVILCSED